MENNSQVANNPIIVTTIGTFILAIIAAIAKLFIGLGSVRSSISKEIKEVGESKVGTGEFKEYKYGHEKVHDEYREDIREIKQGIRDLNAK